MEVIEMMISKGSTAYSFGLSGACSRGNKEAALLMISKGARTLDIALEYCALQEDTEIIDLILSKGATKVNQLLLNRETSFKIIRHALSRGAVTLFPFRNIFSLTFFLYEGDKLCGQR